MEGGFKGDQADVQLTICGSAQIMTNLRRWWHWRFLRSLDHLYLPVLWGKMRLVGIFESKVYAKNLILNPHKDFFDVRIAFVIIHCHLPDYWTELGSENLLNIWKTIRWGIFWCHHIWLEKPWRRCFWSSYRFPRDCRWSFCSPRWPQSRLLFIGHLLHFLVSRQPMVALSGAVVSFSAFISHSW